MPQRTVVVLGGYGVFGSLIAAQLAARPDVHLVVVGRDATRGGSYAQQIGARFRRCDVRDAASLYAVLADAFLVIHAAGPFNDSSHPVARAALAAGAHYLDLADDPKHVATIDQLDEEARQRGLFVCAGASTTPGASAAMVRALTDDGLVPTRILSAVSPGNRNPRGVATVSTILRYVGEQIPVTVGGRTAIRYGWHDGELVDFPAPVGRRRVYTVEGPDTILFPKRFGAQTVIFKAGLELPALNWAMAGLARLRRLRLLPNLAGQSRLLTLLSWATYGFGSPSGAAGVWVEGICERRTIRRSLALVARHDGPHVAAAPAVLLAHRLLDGGCAPPGASACLDQIDVGELAKYLEAFDIRAVRN